jgi:hypothetical protein
MKAASTCILKSLYALTLIIFCAALTAQAQSSRDKYIISAKAGGVNYVAGNVTVQREGETKSQSLTDKDDLNPGDVVTTGMGGRIEVLLNPGSYLRVAENSEFELEETALDNLRIRLTKGSAVVEATGADGLRLLVEIITPQTKVAIVRRGIYRVDVLASNVTVVSVRKGRALVGRDESLTLKDNRTVTIGSTVSEITKLDKKNQDSFDIWSKERAETLARANRSIQNQTLIASLEDYNWTGGYNDGVWVYNRRSGCYSFYPFGGGWSSPYGYNYSGRPPGPVCNGCGGGNRPGNQQPPPNPGGGGGNTPPPAGGNSPPSTGGNPGRRGPREPIDDGPSNPGNIDRGRGGVDRSGGIDRNGGGGGGSVAMPSAPAREEPAPSMPAPSSPPTVSSPPPQRESPPPSVNMPSKVEREP